MNSIFSPKSNLILMQNCDLPPPLKLFSSPSETFFSNDKMPSKDYSRNDKLELLKALRLSQTRAREAERKLRLLTKEKDSLSNLLIEESLRLFTHRQWVKLLEFQVFKLKRQQLEENTQIEDLGGSSGGEKSSKLEDYDHEGTCSMKWYAATIACCLAIAGIGFAFGCRYLS